MRRRCEGVIYGRTCDGLDLIAAGEMEELEEGDWLWFPNMGAYTSVTSSKFNGFERPDLIIGDLPDLSEFNESDWPTNIKYVNYIKA
jgi:hypothetical protein